MIDTGLISSTRQCRTCNYDVAKLMIYSEKGKERLVYRCMKNDCRIKNSFLPGIKLSFEIYIFVVFLILCNSNYRFIISLTSVLNDTILKIIKLKLREYLKKIRKRWQNWWGWCSSSGR
jgi:hypothetical protein